MKQKFRKLTFVMVTSKVSESMSHFDNGFKAIINASYSQLYGGDDIKSYSLYKVVDNEIVNSIAWYYENQLTELPEQDRYKAEEMIESYNLK